MYSLVDQPWIDCIAVKGEYVAMGLHEVLVRSHELVELWGDTPLETAALHRLLLAVLHRVFGPASEKEWAWLWQAGCFDGEALRKYFDRWGERFDLFSDRRFYQYYDKRPKVSTVAKLMPHVATGSKATLFDHHSDDQGIALSLEEAARVLVTAQTFGFCGLLGRDMYAVDGPCTRDIVFLVQGRTLFETLMYNLTRYPSSDDPHQTQDRPAWEQDDPFLPEEGRPYGRLDLYTWQSRRPWFVGPESIRAGLVVEWATQAPGLKLGPEAMLDPMKVYMARAEDKPLRALRYDLNRPLWLHGTALLVQAPLRRPLPAWQWLEELVKHGQLSKMPTTVCAYGMATKSGQQKAFFYRQENLAMPQEVVTQAELLRAADAALELAREAGRLIWSATRTMANLLINPRLAWESSLPKPKRKQRDKKMKQLGVEKRFLESLEQPFREWLQSLSTETDVDMAMEAWQQTVRKAGWKSMEIPAASQRQLDAMSHGRIEFGRRFGRLIHRDS